MISSKVACRVNQTYTGLLQLHEQELLPASANMPAVVAWFGVLDLTCDLMDGKTLQGTDISIHLEDGRIGQARVLASRIHMNYLVEVEDRSGPSALFAIVGLSQLCVPVDISNNI